MIMRENHSLVIFHHHMNCKWPCVRLYKLVVSTELWLSAWGLLVQVDVQDPRRDVTKQMTGTEFWSLSMKHLKNYHSSHVNINPFQAPGTYIHL